MISAAIAISATTAIAIVPRMKSATGMSTTSACEAAKIQLAWRAVSLRKARPAYHQSAIGAGPGFLERHPHSYDPKRLRDGPHFGGYILGDDLVGCLDVGRGARPFFLVAQFPGATIADYDGYWEGEALLARLDILT